MLSSLENINLRLVDEPGENKKAGKYKDKPLPYGACCVCTPDDIPNPRRIEWMADYINTNKKSFIEAGATDIIFWIYWYGIQGNMEFTPTELAKIADLNIPLCVDYIFQDEDD